MAWYDLIEREFGLVFGILCLIISIFFGYREMSDWFEREEGDYFSNSYTIKIMGAVIVFFVIGVIGVYNFFN